MASHAPPFIASIIRRIVCSWERGRLAYRRLTALENNRASAPVLKQVQKALGFLELNPNHPGLNSHEFASLTGVNGEKVFEAYAQNSTLGADRIFWHYGPDEYIKKKRLPVITIIPITPPP